MELSEAFETLNDEEKRKLYDQFGEEGVKGRPGGNGFHQGGNFQSFNFQSAEKIFEQ